MKLAWKARLLRSFMGVGLVPMRWGKYRAYLGRDGEREDDEDWKKPKGSNG